MQPTGNLTPGIRGEAGELRWPSYHYYYEFCFYVSRTFRLRGILTAERLFGRFEKRDPNRLTPDSQSVSPPAPSLPLLLAPPFSLAGPHAPLPTPSQPSPPPPSTTPTSPRLSPHLASHAELRQLLPAEVMNLFRRRVERVAMLNTPTCCDTLHFFQSSAMCFLFCSETFHVLPFIFFPDIFMCFLSRVLFGTPVIRILGGSLSTGVFSWFRRRSEGIRTRCLEKKSRSQVFGRGRSYNTTIASRFNNPYCVPTVGFDLGIDLGESLFSCNLNLYCLGKLIASPQHNHKSPTQPQVPNTTPSPQHNPKSPTEPKVPNKSPSPQHNPKSPTQKSPNTKKSPNTTPKSPTQKSPNQKSPQTQPQVPKHNPQKVPNTKKSPRQPQVPNTKSPQRNPKSPTQKNTTPIPNTKKSPTQPQVPTQKSPNATPSPQHEKSPQDKSLPQGPQRQARQQLGTKLDPVRRPREPSRPGEEGASRTRRATGRQGARRGREEGGGEERRWEGEGGGEGGRRERKGEGEGGEKGRGGRGGEEGGRGEERE
ncbi:hypothetical protein C7M84_021752 [Penaeus vannamei]|uniref:Uncharacterized protein n=1 Tax=Penaeus vannamei TaxID=6689 RepID=A0A3R7LVX9_PENVA|nr:hypothetical protein C7M84_021752 [Penaeus vannamei]